MEFEQEEHGVWLGGWRISYVLSSRVVLFNYLAVVMMIALVLDIILHMVVDFEHSDLRCFHVDQCLDEVAHWREAMWRYNLAG